MNVLSVELHFVGYVGIFSVGEMNASISVEDNFCQDPVAVIACWSYGEPSMKVFLPLGSNHS